MIDYPFVPVAFTRVSITDQFWGPRIETNRAVTIPYDFQKCEETYRIRNFEIAAGLVEGEHVGIYFNDSDVYKVIEGAAYALNVQPDPALERYIDGIVDKIEAAQEEDGYLYTIRTINPEKVHEHAGPTRWSNLAYVGTSCTIWGICMRRLSPTFRRRANESYLIFPSRMPI